MTTEQPAASPAEADPRTGSLADRLVDDLATLDKELGEIELLINQARTEASRHESRRTAAADKLAALPADSDPRERLEQTTTLVTLTKRAALMESQVDVLDGKLRVLTRFRETIADYAASGGDLGPVVGGTGATDPDAPMDPAVSRFLATAQEDLRRDIARAMHDGPAQSLANIVLQAQIVERLVGKDPELASGEVRQLVSMVQQTLDTTKSFIFDVRPMVLDDLGLVPTLRRSTRDRGQRASIPVDFESIGQDRRLAMEVESGLFRMLDEALAAYLSAGPERVTLHLDWGEQLEARLVATRAVERVRRGDRTVEPAAAEAKELPPALAAMLEQRLADEREAQEAAERKAIVTLPAVTWREIAGRAAAIGVTAELLAGGGELRLVADLPASEPTPEAADPA